MSRPLPSQFHSRFPIFERRVYVNSCSQGALSTDVEAAMREYMESWHDGGSPWEQFARFNPVSFVSFVPAGPRGA